MAVIQFVGVSTGSSKIHSVFPYWMRLLGLDADVVGVDVPLGASAEVYRGVLDGIRGHKSCLGAVVTSHKVELFRAAAGQFDALDSSAVSCQEINAVRHRDGQLTGFARDPVSVGRVVDAMWPDLDAGLLCLGSGGTAIALGRHLLARGQRGMLHFLDRDPSAAERLRRVLADGRVVAEVADDPFDAWLADLPPGSLVVNATGAGKDRPGSPVTDTVVFPREVTVWELNYRGDLRMLDTARAQEADRGLVVHDGLSLFCHGWAAALAPVLDLPDDPLLADRFASVVADCGPFR
jgi:shikimate dehydrogenase